MGEGQLGGVLAEVRRLIDTRTASELSDAQLLTVYTEGRDQAAFEALLRRYGALVLSVCRRRLSDPEDIEDAFQATFVVLVRKAGTIQGRAQLSSWLYGVANRIALRLAAQRSRRRQRHRPLEDQPAALQPCECERQELRGLLDTEVGRLPEKYRVPVLLCYLQSRTQEEAARFLGWPQGTVATRLRRGRDRLRQRLVGRGVATSAGPLLAAAVPSALEAATVQACLFPGSGASVAAVALAEGVLRRMLLFRIQHAVLFWLTLGIIGTGAGVLALHHPAAAPAPPALPAVSAASSNPRLSFRVLDAAGYVNALAFSPDGKVLASVAVIDDIARAPAGEAAADPDRGVKLWDPATGKPRQRLATLVPPLGSALHTLAFSPDGKMVAAVGDAILVWDETGGTPKGGSGGPSEQCLCFSPDGNTLAAGGSDGIIRLYLAHKGLLKAVLPSHRGAVVALAFSSDGATLISAGLDGRVREWGISQGKLREEHEVAMSHPWRVLLAQDGSSAAWWSLEEPGVRVWDRATRETRDLGRTRRDGSPPDAVALSLDGRMLAVAADLGTLTLWDVKGGTNREIARQGTQFTALAFTADGQTLASADLQGIVKLWQLGPDPRATSDHHLNEGGSPP
jgi:RNA polymerase sigma factor (sigma-70 family)